MRAILTPFLGLLIIFATSCDVKLANDPQVRAIDSTLTVVNTTLEALDTLDVSSFEKLSDRLVILDSVAWTYYEFGDTAKYWKNEISKLQLCIKSLDRYEGQSKAILLTLNENKQQLKTLKHDLENDLVDKEKIEEYVAIEIEITANVLAKASKHGGRAMYCLQSYGEIVAKADRIIKQLKTED